MAHSQKKVVRHWDQAPGSFLFPSVVYVYRGFFSVQRFMYINSQVSYILKYQAFQKLKWRQRKRKIKNPMRQKHVYTILHFPYTSVLYSSSSAKAASSLFFPLYLGLRLMPLWQKECWGTLVKLFSFLSSSIGGILRLSLLQIWWWMSWAGSGRWDFLGGI